MAYKFISPNGHTITNDVADPEAFIAAQGLVCWTYEAIPLPPQPATDPAQQLADDIAFGENILTDFLAAAKQANLGLATAEALRAKLATVHYYLSIGSIGTALEALQAVAPDALFSSEAKAHYISILEDYLA